MSGDDMVTMAMLFGVSCDELMKERKEGAA